MRHADSSVVLGGAHQGGCLVVVHLIDHAQLQGLALGVGQGVQSLGQLGRLDRSVDLGLDLGELIRIVVKLEPSLWQVASSTRPRRW